MTQDVENLILEHLRAIRADIGQIKADGAEVKVRLMTIEAHNAATQLDIVRHSSALDTLDQRVQRIEKRLELTQ